MLHCIVMLQMEQYLLNCWALFSMLKYLGRFFSQMMIVKIDWKNSLSECNLTSLLWIKVSCPTLKVFFDKYCAKVVNNWCHDKNHRINQKPQKKYWKQKASKPSRKEFHLPYFFKTSSESKEEEDVTIL